ncbi:MAG: hypothetical protein KF852_04285 [Saprospiraceae bacterium]|nr:hypothetical protein [Saprospiraceae bacterium]
MPAANEILRSLKTDYRAAEDGPKSAEWKDAEWQPFYEIKWNSEGEIREIKINFAKLVDLLKGMGFRRLDIGKMSFLVHIKDNIVKEVSQKEIIDSFVEWLDGHGANLPDGVMIEAMKNKLYKSLGTYFSESLLHRLTNEEPIRFNEHNEREAYFYYRNGYVCVDATGTKLMPYNTLKHYIWANQILNRDFTPTDMETVRAANFSRFVSNIGNAWKLHPLTKAEHTPDTARLEAFETIIGYCLHSYYEGKLRAVIFTDARISEDASGRTGKTLLCKALGYMLNAEKYSSTYVELNGKDFDTKDRFKYQELTIDTRLVHINDIARGFSFEDLFNDITEGIRAQRKNEAPFPVQAKMVISTNRTIRIHGDSSKDRCTEFEMADYYGADWSPEMEFKQWFFRDWSAHEWACFDSYMLHCVQQFLHRGLLKPGAINLIIRKMVEETAPEFIRFMEDRELVHGQEYDKKELYNQFQADNSDFKQLKQKTFTRWLRLFGDSHGDFSGYEERRSSGKDLIKFFRKAKETIPF